ncbi:MAG: diadenylate cyclase CdaA [Oscillospiraceae bacterium]|jgi:diadenylate cyclase|nr:diadenylate cyclase CdaA [Oscillospiraceae bacterium]
MQIWQQYAAMFKSLLASVRVADVADILIVAYLVYKLLMLTWETRASAVLKGLAVLLLASWLSSLLELRALNSIITIIVNSGTVVLVVLFQPEIRRALQIIGSGSSGILDRIRSTDEHANVAKIVSEITGALLKLSKRRVGALIVVEQKTGLKDVIDTGTTIDSTITSQLIENVFEPNTPLHDGAMIIRGTRIIAAACFLTISEDRSISRELGTRHRAALGITETTDAISLIVSEETGIISVARSGKLTRHLDAASLGQILTDIFTAPETINPLKSLLLKKNDKKTDKKADKKTDKKTNGAVEKARRDDDATG